MTARVGVQTLFIAAWTGELFRVVMKNQGDKMEPTMRRLMCPVSDARPCSLDCAMLGAVEDEVGTLLVCREGGNRVILGQPDPERTDIDEMNALTAASAFAEQRRSEDER